MLTWPGEEPMGCWALLLGATEHEVRGLMVMSGTGEWRLVQVTADGSILTEVLLRRGRELGFSRALVWTDPKLVATVNWYKNRVGFEPINRRPLEIGAEQDFITFEHAVLPAPEG